MFPIVHYDPSDNIRTLKRTADVTISLSDAYITNPITMKYPWPPPCDVEVGIGIFQFTYIIIFIFIFLE